MADTKTSLLPNPLTVTTLASNDKVVVYDLSADSLTTAQVDAIAARQSYPLWDGTNWEFKQSSVPTTRPGGGALGVGDTWVEQDETQAIARDWFWNGTYWLSRQTFIIPYQFQGAITSSNAFELFYPIDSKANVFLTDFYMAILLGATNDGDNYWTLMLAKRPSGANALSGIDSLSTVAEAPGNNVLIRKTLNIHVSASGAIMFDFRWTRIGSASTIEIGSAAVEYRLARL